MCLGGGTRFCSSVPDGRSETDIPPRHFRERHIPDWRAELGFKDVSQIEQIFVGKLPDRGFDLRKAPHRVIAAIGDPLHSCLEHMAFYHKRCRGGRGIIGELAKVIRQRRSLPAVERRFPMETAPLSDIRRGVETYGLRREIGAFPVYADRPHLRQNWWKPARPLSGSDRRKRTFVQTVGQGTNQPLSGALRSNAMRLTNYG